MLLTCPVRGDTNYQRSPRNRKPDQRYLAMTQKERAILFFQITGCWFERNESQRPDLTVVALSQKMAQETVLHLGFSTPPVGTVLSAVTILGSASLGERKSWQPTLR